KIGEEIGKEIGALEKSRDAIKTVLTVRFGQISSEIEEIIGKMTNPTIAFLIHKRYIPDPEQLNQQRFKCAAQVREPLYLRRATKISSYC
ncbi:hypothetical protein PN446_14790, partial [Microcystis aeruginosa CS-567/02]|nr:hypothetical protein [Microcystis aeruginosa CS-567/02]